MIALINDHLVLSSNVKGVVTPIDSIIVTTATTVRQQSQLKPFERLPSTFKSGGVICEVKCQKSAQSTVKTLKRDGQGFDIRSQL